MTDKKERLFVIMEVEESSLHPDGTMRYNPLDKEEHEGMWLKPSRIIPESRLRYDLPKDGETYFAIWDMGQPSQYVMGWEPADGKKGFRALILDPEPEEEKDEWEEWAEDSPVCDPNSEAGRQIIDWLKRMPRRD